MRVPGYPVFVNSLPLPLSPPDTCGGGSAGNSMLSRRPVASSSSSSHNSAFHADPPSSVVISKGRGEDVPHPGGVSKHEEQYRTAFKGRVDTPVNLCLSQQQPLQHEEGGCGSEGSPFPCVSTASSPDNSHHLSTTSYDVTASPSSLSSFPHAIEYRIHSPSSTDALVSPDDESPPSLSSTGSCSAKKGCCRNLPESVSLRECMPPHFTSASKGMRECPLPFSLASSSPTVEGEKAYQISSTTHPASHRYSGNSSSREPSHIAQLPVCPTLLPQPPRPVGLSQKEKASATVLAQLLQDTLTPRSLRVLVVGCAGRLGRLVFKHLLNIEKHDERRWLHVTGLARDANTRMQLLKEDPDICREDVIVCDIRDTGAVREVFGLPPGPPSSTSSSSSSSCRFDMPASTFVVPRRSQQERLYRSAWLRYQDVRSQVERALLDAPADPPSIRCSIAAHYKPQLREIEQRLLSLQPSEGLFDAVIICTSSRLSPVKRRSGNIISQEDTNVRGSNFSKATNVSKFFHRNGGGGANRPRTMLAPGGSRTTGITSRGVEELPSRSLQLSSQSRMDKQPATENNSLQSHSGGGVESNSIECDRADRSNTSSTNSCNGQHACTENDDKQGPSCTTTEAAGGTGGMSPEKKDVQHGHHNSQGSSSAKKSSKYRVGKGVGGGGGFPGWFSWGGWFGKTLAGTSQKSRESGEELKSTVESVEGGGDTRQVAKDGVHTTTEGDRIMKTTDRGGSNPISPEKLHEEGLLKSAGSVQTIASRDHNGTAAQSLASTISDVGETTETASLSISQVTSTTSQGELPSLGDGGGGGGIVTSKKGREDSREITTTTTIGESRSTTRGSSTMLGENGDHEASSSSSSSSNAMIKCGGVEGDSCPRLSKSLTSHRITLYDYLRGYPREVDWLGQKNIIDAANEASVMHIVLCSMMGGTSPTHHLNLLGRRKSRLRRGETGGDILLWKRRSERYLVRSGLTYTIVHPGGLSDEPGGRGLVVGVNDVIKSMPCKSISREDVARVLVHSLIDPSYLNQSFDVLNEAPRRCIASLADHEHMENIKSSAISPFLNGVNGERGETATATLWTLMEHLKNVKYDYARSGADQLLAAHEQTEESRIMFDNLLRGQQQRHTSRMDSTRRGRRS
ncbi:nad-dependent epimerase dehydratase [Cystoisospora suis]|uniref:Nad-dependent epimerase dehydratase n=1 Tax=Cystoisospora suis TaxID=483139 RepID=A0A2C6LFJ7_9APIC|nr:nad-dependent epimerase dehydratase [Cystoisospora suis]